MKRLLLLIMLLYSFVSFSQNPILTGIEAPEGFENAVDCFGYGPSEFEWVVFLMTQMVIVSLTNGFGLVLI